MKAKNTVFIGMLSLLVVVMYAPSCRKNNTDLVVTTGSGDTTTDGFVTNSLDTTISNAVIIKYGSGTATVTNPFSSDGVSVAINNGKVVVSSTNTATAINYVLLGSISDGMCKIYSDAAFNLYLNGAAITNTNGPAINIQSSKKATVTLLTGTKNRLIDAATYASSSEDQKASFFSEGQLVFNGSGSLAVTGKYKHAIASDDYIEVDAGTISVASSVSDGIHANDYFEQNGGAITINAGSDGIQSEEGYIVLNGGETTITSVDDGLSASYDGTVATITPYITVNGGSQSITTSGEKGHAFNSSKQITINSSGTIVAAASGKGAKGLKSGSDILIQKGTITINNSSTAYYNSTDADIVAPAAINCDGNLAISGGTLVFKSTGQGGKGITTDGTISISGGAVDVTASGATYTYTSSSTSEAKGVKSDGAFVISGGNLAIAATDDGIKTETSISINSGTVSITKSTEGIEGPAINFNGGTTTVVSSDDAVNGTKGSGGENSDGSLITFAGGLVSLSTTGGDAIDGNGNITMTNGTVIAQGPPSSPELAIDVNGSFTISGGLLVGSGPNSGNMIEATSTSSAQYGMLVKFNSQIAAGALITVQDASGNNLVTYAPTRQAYYFIFSSSALIGGAAYKIYSGGSYTGGSSTSGLYTGGTYTSGTLRGTVTLSSKLTTTTL